MGTKETMQKVVSRLVPSFIKKYLGIPARLSKTEERVKKLKTRVRNLEISLDALIESPTYITDNTVGFNGQLQRKKIFTDIVTKIPFDGIIETGTEIGNTTGYMAEKTSYLPIYTCELNPRFASLAQMRLKAFHNISFQVGDSREFLKHLSTSEIAGRATFFYLDAHWYDDLPLREEIDIVVNAWERFVLMIDDFQVPNDDGYGYDRYRRHKPLSLSLIADLIQKYDLVSFFPASPSVEETGKKRGCVVLTKRGPLSETLSQIPSLTQ